MLCCPMGTLRRTQDDMGFYLFTKRELIVLFKLKLFSLSNVLHHNITSIKLAAIPSILFLLKEQFCHWDFYSLVCLVLLEYLVKSTCLVRSPALKFLHISLATAESWPAFGLRLSLP